MSETKDKAAPCSTAVNARQGENGKAVDLETDLALLTFSDFEALVRDPEGAAQRALLLERLEHCQKKIGQRLALEELPPSEHEKTGIVNSAFTSAIRLVEACNLGIEKE